MATAAQIRANTANAALARGSVTPEGRERSKANAMRHGLCAKVIGLEPPEEIREQVKALEAGERTTDPIAEFKVGVWLLNQAATLGQRIEHAQALQEAARERSALRAGVVWEDDRRFEAVEFGEKLARRGKPDPLALEKLRRTPQGCDWLISRWAWLAHAADAGQGWTPEQANLAYCLLGSPETIGEGASPGAESPAQGVDPAGLARGQIAELHARKGLIKPLDEADRKQAEAGLADDAEIRRLRRYEAALERRFRWTFDLLREASAPPTPPETGPLEPEPEAPAPPPEAPTGPGSFAIGKPPLLKPTREPSRAERRAIKAESRRESKRRKLEERRA